MTIKRAAALLAVVGACLTVVGATLWFGLAGGLITAGVCLMLAGSSSL